MLVRGVVRTLTGASVEGATVLFADAPVDVPDIAASTGGDGAFALAAPAPGRYRVAVRANGHVDHEIDVDVAEGLDVEIEARLAPAGDEPPR